MRGRRRRASPGPLSDLMTAGPAARQRNRFPPLADEAKPPPPPPHPPAPPVQPRHSPPNGRAAPGGGVVFSAARRLQDGFRVRPGCGPTTGRHAGPEECPPFSGGDRRNRSPRKSDGSKTISASPADPCRERRSSLEPAASRSPQHQRGSAEPGRRRGRRAAVVTSKTRDRAAPRIEPASTLASSSPKGDRVPRMKRAGKPDALVEVGRGGGEI